MASASLSVTNFYIVYSQIYNLLISDNLGTGPLDASINVNGNIVDGVADFTWAPILNHNRRLTDILNQI